MTTPSQVNNPFVRYTLSTALTYDISFDVTSAAGVRVFINATELTRGIGFNVVGTDAELRAGNGQITLTDTPTPNDVLLILRDTRQVRVTNFEQAARFSADILDSEFDNMLRLLEDSALFNTATPHFAPSDIGLLDGELPPAIANGILVVNEAGDGFEYTLLSDSPEFAAVVAQLNDLLDQAAGIPALVEQAEQAAIVAVATGDEQVARVEASGEATLDLVRAVQTLPVILWVEGEEATAPLQRYLFGNVVYVAPTAALANPIALGATPVGDSNWTDWSTPFRYFAFERLVTTPQSVFTIGTTFESLGDVFLGGNIQDSTSFNFSAQDGTVTFNETLPTGTHVKIWVGRNRDAIVEDLEEIRDRAILAETNAAADAAIFVNQFPYDAGDIATPTMVFRPNRLFTSATLFAGGVPQRQGANEAFTLETDSVSAQYTQIRFSEPLPVGTELFGLLRD